MSNRPAKYQGRYLRQNSPKQPAAEPSRMRLPPWMLAAVCLLYDALLFHVWTEPDFSAGRLVALCLLSLGFALLTALFATIGKKPWLHLLLALVISVFWALAYLTEYFILDSFKNFYTPAGIFTGAGNAGQADFAARTLGLVGKNLWRVGLFALPLLLWPLQVCFKGLPRVPTRGSRRWLAGIGALLLGLGLAYGAIVSPDRGRMGSEYSFTEAVHSFGLPTALALDLRSGIGGEFSLDGEETVWTLPSEEPAASLPADTEGRPAIESTEALSPDSPENLEHTEATEAPTPQVPAKRYNMLDLDLDAIAAAGGKAAELANYLKTLAPSRTNEMTGLFAGKNLILISAEAFSGEFIDPELTPALYRMANRGIRFTDYYQPAWGGSTSSGEFSILTGIYPARGVDSITDTIGKNMAVTIGNQLRSLGYFTRAYHNNSYTYYKRNLTHENLGYERFIGMGNGMEEGVAECWPESDLEMIDFTLPQFIDQQPFSIYYMTVSGHGLYSWHGNNMSAKNKEAVAGLDCSETVKAYIACNVELEYAMEHLLAALEEAGIAEDTLVVLSTDHYPYCLEKSDAWGNDRDYLSEYYGDQVQSCFDRDHSTLIMWSACLEGLDLTVETPCSSLDIVPTLCNLFGVDFDSRLLSGRDLFSDKEPLVFWPDHSWITDKGRWNASMGSGREFTPAQGAELPEGYADGVCRDVNNRISYAMSVLRDLDFFGLIFD